MSLITCPDCLRPVSDQAASCIGCGYPIARQGGGPPPLPMHQTALGLDHKTSTKSEPLSFGGAITSVFTKYAVFSGRARRSEYWWFFALNAAVGFFFTSLILAQPASASQPIRVAYGLYILVMLLPNASVFVRRLHDVNRSGWSYVGALSVFFFVLVASSFALNSNGNGVAIFINVITLLALFGYCIAVFVWICSDGTRGPNRYGPDPRGRPGN